MGFLKEGDVRPSISLYFAEEDCGLRAKWRFKFVTTAVYGTCVAKDSYLVDCVSFSPLRVKVRGQEIQDEVRRSYIRFYSAGHSVCPWTSRLRDQRNVD